MRKWHTGTLEGNERHAMQETAATSVAPGVLVMRGAESSRMGGYMSPQVDGLFRRRYGLNFPGIAPASASVRGVMDLTMQADWNRCMPSSLTFRSQSSAEQTQLVLRQFVTR